MSEATDSVMEEYVDGQVDQTEYGDTEQVTLTASDVGVLNLTDQPFSVSLPSNEDREGLQSLLTELKSQKDKRGVTTLAKWLDKYLMHQAMSDKLWAKTVATASFVNGVRLPSQKVGDKKRSLRNDAQDFYEAMTTPMLRMHCKLFSIDYDAYECMEEVIGVLVQKHVDMIEPAA